ncbi:MAG: hypothetical protein QF785_02555 [Phycisphaeraceae bacterium]|jgi:hypothetical protein|nr:hypothetical protein [Phycisphaeraceae bacterium]MDP7348486.1 hypothetical protein [Phycisphaeraceae bacterium]
MFEFSYDIMRHVILVAFMAILIVMVVWSVYQLVHHGLMPWLTRRERDGDSNTTTNDHE